MANIYFFRPITSEPIVQTLILDLRNALRGHSFETYTLISNGVMPLNENPSFSMVSADVFIVFAKAEDLETELFLDHVIQLVNYSLNVQKIFIPILFGNFLPLGNYSPIVKDILQSPYAVKIPSYSREEVRGHLDLLNYSINDYISNKLTEAKAQEIKQNIEENAPQFITKSTERLKKRASDLRETARHYFVGAYFIIIVGIALAIWFYSVDKHDLQKMTNTLAMVFFFVKGLVVLTLVTAVVKYSFSLGKAYMHEALKIEDRIHAISFGEFYLNVYKEGVKPDELKEVFRDWNINNTSTAFMAQNSDEWDPKILEKMLDVLGKAKDVVKKD